MTGTRPAPALPHGTAGALCACGCGRPRGPKHRGWSRACYFRWYRAGKPKDGPPAPRKGPEHSAAKGYVASLKPIPECAHHGCTAAATRRRWCEEHQDVQRLYLDLRAQGVGRTGAAFRVGVHLSTTYVWEPGDDTRGRPRKEESEAHREDYWFLRENGTPMKDAAARAGITVQTARKWERDARPGAAA